MSDMADGVDTTGLDPVEDSEIEALLTGSGTDRQDLASLDRFIEELRAPCPIFDPRPTGELARLFAEGPGGAFGQSPPPSVAGGWMVPPPAPGRAASTGRTPVRRLAKVAAVTTTATLALTLAAAAQVLPGSQARTAVSVSGPATPVPVGADQSVTVRTSGVAAATGVTLPPPSTPLPLRPAVTARSGAQADLDALSPEALARLPFDILRALSPETLARLPVEVLRTLPGETLARLSPEVQKTLPPDALAKLPVDALTTLPGDVLARLSHDVLRTLPTESLLRLPADAVRGLSGDLLARLPLDVLRALPADVQRRLPVDTLRLVLGSPAPGVTPSTTGAPRP